MGWKKAKCASHQSKVEFPIIKGRTPSRLSKWYNFYFFFQIKSYFVGQPKVSLIPLCNFFLWHFSDLSFSGWGSLKSLKQGFKVSWMGWDTYWHPFQFHRKSHPMKYFAFLNQTLFLFSYDVSGFLVFHKWLAFLAFTHPKNNKLIPDPARITECLFIKCHECKSMLSETFDVVIIHLSKPFAFISF